MSNFLYGFPTEMESVFSLSRSPALYPSSRKKENTQAYNETKEKKRIAEREVQGKRNTVTNTKTSSTITKRKNQRDGRYKKILNNGKCGANKEVKKKKIFI